MFNKIKTLITAGLLIAAASVSAIAATARYAEVRPTGSLQPNTTGPWAVHVGSGTIDAFRADTATATRINSTTGVISGVSGSTVTYSSATLANLTVTGTERLIGTSNQVVIGTTTTTINVQAPASARTLTISDNGTDAYIVVVSSRQSISGGQPFGMEIAGRTMSWTGTTSNHLLWKYAVLKSTVTGDVQISQVPLDDSDQSLLVTTNISGNGANGLDTGSVAANTWYYIYLIGDGTNVAGLYSVQSPTSTYRVVMPTGYRYMRFFSTVRTNASSQIIESAKTGKFTQWTVSAQAVVVGSTFTNTTANRVDVSSGAPPITAWRVNARTLTGPIYNVAGIRVIAASVGQTGKGLRGCGATVYQPGDGVTNLEYGCDVDNITIFSEGGAGEHAIDWAQANGSANRVSQYTYIYITGYYEDTW